MTRAVLVDAICTELHDAIDAGVGATLRLVGEAGIDKSTILAQLRRKTHTRS